MWDNNLIPLRPDSKTQWRVNPLDRGKYISIMLHILKLWPSWQESVFKNVFIFIKSYLQSNFTIKQLTTSGISWINRYSNLIFSIFQLIINNANKRKCNKTVIRPRRTFLNQWKKRSNSSIKRITAYHRSWLSDVDIPDVLILIKSNILPNTVTVSFSWRSSFKK